MSSPSIFYLPLYTTCYLCNKEFDLKKGFGCPDCKCYSKFKICKTCNKNEVELQKYVLTTCFTCSTNAKASMKMKIDAL